MRRQLIAQLVLLCVFLFPPAATAKVACDNASFEDGGTQCRRCLCQIARTPGLQNIVGDPNVVCGDGDGEKGSPDLKHHGDILVQRNPLAFFQGCGPSRTYTTDDEKCVTACLTNPIEACRGCRTVDIDWAPPCRKNDIEKVENASACEVLAHELRHAGQMVAGQEAIGIFPGCSCAATADIGAHEEIAVRTQNVFRAEHQDDEYASCWRAYYSRNECSCRVNDPLGELRVVDDTEATSWGMNPDCLCGDGTIQGPQETCDPGDTKYKLSPVDAACRGRCPEQGEPEQCICPKSPSPTPTPTNTCGDYIIQPSEECDGPASASSTSLCREDCREIKSLSHK